MFGDNLTKFTANDKDVNSGSLPSKVQIKSSSTGDLPPTAKKSTASKVPKSESNVSLVSLTDFEPYFLYDEPLLNQKSNVSRLCGQMFGNEYVESELSGSRAFELVNEFGLDYIEPMSDFRPFLNLKENRRRSKRIRSISAEEIPTYLDTTNNAQNAKALESRPSNSDLVAENKSTSTTTTSISSSKVLVVYLGPNEKKLVTLEVTPSATFQDTFPDSKYKLVERNVELNIAYDNIDDLHAKVLLSYKNCISKVSITPNLFNLGLCNIGESYPFTIVVNNESDLPTVLRPSISPAVTDIEIKPLAINAQETREINLQYLPARENHDYRVNITFRNSENEKNINTLEVVARAVDTQHTQIHDFFYKISNKDSYNNQNQIIFGKILACMPNISMFRIKNISRMPLKIQFFTQDKSMLKIYLLKSKKSSTNQVIEKKSTVEESLQRKLEFEDLKWGDKKNSSGGHGVTQRVSIDDDPESKYRSKSKLEDFSQSLKALDVLPPQLSRSANSSTTTATPITRSIRQPSVSMVEVNMEEAAAQFLSSEPSSVKQNGDIDMSNVVDLELLQNLNKQFQQGIVPWIFEDASFDSLEHDLTLLTEDGGTKSDTATSNDASKSAESNAKVNNDFSKTISTVQSFYQSLQSILDTMATSASQWYSNLETLHHSSDVVEYSKACETTIAEEASVHVVVIWKPDTSHYTNDISAASSLREYIQIRLPEVDHNTISTVVHSDAQDPDKVKVGELLEEDPLFSLAPKPLLVRSECFRSEMTIIQRNINYGRVAVGDTTFKTVTIVNKSPVSCIYSFTKSGNITSGFLSILHGRKGVLAPFSTKVVQITFKPTMPCTFEEVLQIKNLLNPMDEHTITIKAKVSKAESFALSVAEDSPDVINENAKKFIEGQYSIDSCHAALRSILKSFAVEGSGVAEKAANPLIAMLGISAVGKTPTVTLKIKLRNPTNKKRQFIVDAVSKDSLTLLDYAVMKGSQELTSDESAISLLQELVDTNGVRFIPIPDYLQSILLVRCSITTELIKSISVNQGMDEEEIRILMDNLEKFQQKLKIAIRKEKPDKIIKYQKKIDDTIKKLSGSSASVATPTTTDASSNSQGKPIASDPLASVSINGSILDQPESSKTEDGKMVDDFDSAQYIWLNPEEERMLTIQLTYLPGRHYKSWKGILPFLGKVRIYEGKNEDNVKVAYIGSYLFSSLASMDSPTGEDNSNILSSSSSIMHSPSSSQFHESIGVAFDCFIPEWSSISTKNIFPKYKKFPANILGASLKLSRSSKDRTLTGTFILTNLLRQNVIFSIGINSHYTSSTTSTYKGPFKPYDPMTSGELNLVTNDAASSVSMSDSDDRYLRVWGNMESRQVERKSIVHDLAKGKFELQCNGGKRKEFSLVWSPSLNVQQSNVEEFNMFGTLEIVYQQQMMLVPFVSVYRHNSIVKAEKYHSIDDVSVGSFVIYKVLVENEATKLHLHYGVILEQVSEKYFSRGSLEIISGRSGVIPPQGKAYITVRFYGTAPGRFEQKMWVRNLNDNFDQRRIVFQSNVTLSQGQFVAFPELEQSSTSGKYAAIQLGQLQIKSSSALVDLSCFDDSIQQNMMKPYELRMKNVSNQRLTVTAIPNLRNQCFIYSNESCIESAINVAMEVGEVTTLYVVLKPADVGKSKMFGEAAAESANSNLSNTGAPPSASAAQDLDTNKQLIRELIGGIRLVFFVHDEASAQSSTKEITNEAPVIGSESPRLQQGFTYGRKLFETALSFRALVGKSLLQASLLGDSDSILKICPQSNPDVFITDNRGELNLKNCSDVFPLNYAFYDDAKVEFVEGYDGLQPMEVSGGNIQLIFNASKRGTLAPNANKVLEFWIGVGSDLTGIHTLSIRLLNLDTNDIVEVCLAIYIDPNKVCSIHDKRDDLCVNAIMVPTNKRELESCSIQDLFWLRVAAGSAEENQLAQALLRPSQLEVVKSSDKTLGCVRFKNLSSTSITLQPMSDLPVSVVVEMVEAIIEDDGEINKQASSTKRSSEEKPIIATKPSSIAPSCATMAVTSRVRRKFKKCGETFVLKPNCIAIAMIQAKSGMIENELGKWMDMKKLSRGAAIPLQGHLCFIEKLSSLQSIFSRPTQDSPAPATTTAKPVKTPVSFSGTEITITSDSDYSLPVVHATTLLCQFMLPRLKIKPNEVDLGLLRLKNFTSFDIEIKNNSQVDLLCAFDMLPSWISFASEFIKSSPTVGMEDANIRRACFIARTGQTYQVQCLVVAHDNKRSNVQHDLKIKSIPLLESIDVSSILIMESLDDYCTSTQNVLVKMKLDKRAALEISATSNETLTVASSATNVQAEPNSKSQLITSFRYNFLRSFLIPPPVVLDVEDYLTSSHDISAEHHPILVAIDSSINEVGVKQSCNFSIKNNFSSALKIMLEFEPIDPELKELMEVSCKFEHSNQQFVELLPEETANIKIRAVPKVDSRLTHSLLEKIDKISKTEFPNDKHNGLSIQNFKNNPEESTQGNLVSRLLKLRSGSSRLGKLLLKPEVVEAKSSETLEEEEAQLAVSSNVPGKQVITKATLTEADLLCVELVGALKLGPTSALLNYSSATNSAIPNASHEIIGGLILDFICQGNNVPPTTNDIQSVDKEVSDELVLASGDHYFFISNPTKSTLRFKVKSMTCRYPGMMLKFSENISEKYDQAFAYCTDTVKVVIEPNEGEIEVGSAIRVKAELIPCNPSESTLCTESELTSEFHNHNNNHIEGGPEGIVEQILLCMPIEIWDKEWPLHPPSIVYAHLSSDTYCPILRSQPISELNRKKQQFDMILSEQSATTEGNSKAVVEGNNSTEQFNLVDELPRLGIDSTVGTVATMDSDVANLGIRLRGITPYPNVDFKGTIDLGRQIQRQEYLEWVVTLENRSKSKRHLFQVFALSYPTTIHWLRLGQSGGVIRPNDSNSIMLYFNRMVPGQYLSFVVIRDVSEESPDQIIRITMEVTADDWRKRSQPLSTPSQGTVDSMSYPWLKEYLPSESLYLNQYVPTIASYDVSSVKDKIFFSVQSELVMQGQYFAGMTIKNITPMALELAFYSKSRCFNLKLLNELNEELSVEHGYFVEVNQSVTLMLQLNITEYHDIVAKQKYSETILASSIRSEWEGSHELKVMDKIFCSCQLFDHLTFYVPVYEILS